MFLIYLLIFITVAFVILGLLYSYFPYKKPLPTESDYTHHITPFFQLYYSSKYLSPVKHPEKNSNLTEYFANIKKPNILSLQNATQIQINAVGDLMFRKDIVPPQSPRLWENIKEKLFACDFSMGNFEFVVNPSNRYYKLLRFSVDESEAYQFTRTTAPYKFSYFSLANNHINDSLHEGIISTANFLDKEGIIHSGANRTKEEQDNFPIVNINGIKIALLSYTFSTNNIPLEKGKEFGTNLVRFNALKDEDYDPSLIYKHIKLAKERGTDIIISSNHWGIEFEYYPPQRIVKRAHELMEAGIDIIIGHHPHILNLSEWYKTKDNRNCLCFYSLGNLTAWALKHPIQKLSQIAGITIEKGIDKNGNTKTVIKNAKLIPTYYHISKKGKTADHTILPLFDAINNKLGNDIKISALDKMALKYVYAEYKKYFFNPNAFDYE